MQPPNEPELPGAPAEGGEPAVVEDVAGSIPRHHQTDSRLPLRAEYGPEDWSGGRAPSGQFPFVRGNKAGGFREQLWNRDIYAGFGSIEDAQGRYEDLLRGGASGVNMAFDLPTQLGLDSDDPEAVAEVGKVGTAVDTLTDLTDLFERMPLDQVKTVFTVGNGIGAVALSWFDLLGESQGVTPSSYVIHLQNDPLKEFTGRGAFIFPVKAHIRLACDVIEYVAKRRLLHWKPIGICGSQFRWGGGDAIHEVALGLSSARVYIEELLRRGLDIDDFAPLLEMHLAADLDLLEEVAKFRAARQVWATMMKEDYGARLPESQHLRISLYTGGYRLTAQEPLNNSVRVTLQALAAVLGGVEHIGTLSIDEALSTPSPEYARLAVQTQNILAYETSIPSVADPLGGSWLVESLTDELAERMVAMDRDVQERGGTMEALRSGHLRSLVEESSFEYQQEIEKGERTVVGVNRFTSDNADDGIKAFRVSDAAALRQAERLAEIRSRRDSSAVNSALDQISRLAERDENLIEAIKDACRAEATIGEITERLKGVFGTWEEDGVFL